MGKGAWQKGVRLTVRRQGVTLVRYRSVDVLGNREATRHCHVRIAAGG